MLKVYDKFGTEQSLSWLREQFGAVEIVPPQPAPVGGYFAVTELRENDDLPPGRGAAHPWGALLAIPSIFVRLLDRAGQPIAQEQAVFWWPDAPALPGSGWWERGVAGVTNGSGMTDFPMGPGAYYAPPAQGPHHLWVFGPDHSELVKGLGMIAGTNHRHLDVTFQWTEPAPMPPDPGLPAPPRIREAVRQIQDAAAHLQKALHALRSATR